MEMNYYYGKPVHQDPYPACFYLTSGNLIVVLLLLVLALLLIFSILHVVIGVAANVNKAVSDLTLLLTPVYADSLVLIAEEKKLS